MTNTMKCTATTLALLLFAATAPAGEKIDDLRTAIGECRTALGQTTFLTRRGSKLADKADRKLERAEEKFASSDDKQRKKGFKQLGKALKKLRKAAKREESPSATAFLEQWQTELWGAALGVFATGVVVDPLSPEDQKILEKVGRKLVRPLRLAAKEKYGRAIKKLAKAFKHYVRVYPDP